MKTISSYNPYNHGSLKTERHIRAISEMIAKQLSGTGQICVTSLVLLGMSKWQNDWVAFGCSIC